MKAMTIFRKPHLRALLFALLAAPALAGTPSGPAPQFQLQSIAGAPVSLGQFKGQVVMINFWASWCGPCRKEMPILDKLYAKYKPMGFTMIGVNVEPDSKDALQWLKATPVTFPILFDTKSEVSKAYQVTGMPSTVIVDRKGNLRWLHSGYKPGDENEYLDQIRALVRE
ncbi:MAG TPA: TlpA disulfide reductase family protein [Steroidobacteraceae bacterium]|nr:TlpA disulfide reductase family protein [Steroidobacteraceae bacterium]